MAGADTPSRGITISEIAVEGLHREHKTEENSSQNPYISFILGTQTEKTATAKHQKSSCSWTEALHFKPSDAEVLAISAIHHRMLAADHIIGHVLVRTDQLTEGRNELVLKSKAHVDTGVVSFCVSGLEWSQPRAGTFTLLPNAQTVSTQQADGIGQDSAAELEPVKPGKVQHNLGYVPNVGSKISEPQPRMAPTGLPQEEAEVEPAQPQEAMHAKTEDFQYITRYTDGRPTVQMARPDYHHPQGSADVLPAAPFAEPVPAKANPAHGSGTTNPGAPEA